MLLGLCVDRDTISYRISRFNPWCLQNRTIAEISLTLLLNMISVASAWLDHHMLIPVDKQIIIGQNNFLLMVMVIIKAFTITVVVKKDNPTTWKQIKNKKERFVTWRAGNLSRVIFCSLWFMPCQLKSPSLLIWFLRPATWNPAYLDKYITKIINNQSHSSSKERLFFITAREKNMSFDTYLSFYGK